MRAAEVSPVFCGALILLSLVACDTDEGSGRRVFSRRPRLARPLPPITARKDGSKLVPHMRQVTADGKFLNPASPPPPRGPRYRPAALPDLPGGGNAPTGPRTAGGKAHGKHCGTVMVGDHMVPLDCLDTSYGRIEHASKPLVSYDALHGGPIKLPNLVDHRHDGTEGPVRDQGTSQSCTALSLASAVDHAVNRWAGLSSTVSSMQVWARYHSPHMSFASSANLEKPLAPDHAWPFHPHTANSWLDVPTCNQLRAAGEVLPECGRPVDLTRLHQVDKRPIAEITDIAVIEDPKDMYAIKAKLALGQDVWIGLHIGQHLSCGRSKCMLGGQPGSRYVYDYDARSEGGHATLLAGYATLARGSTYFLIHNSWGEQWGDRGYAWIHESTLKRNIEHAYVIDAQPIEAERAAHVRRQGGHATCASGLVPDSISAECVPPCPDGSPRHNAVCPIAGHCPGGQVNLTGNCVAAAPVRSGSDQRTGISWKCGPGGCAYEVPKGLGGCEGSPCQMSCPAPDFRLAKGRRGLTCME